MGQFHQHGHAAGIVVGADEQAARVLAVEHRVRQRVVVGAEQDPLPTIRIPPDDQVRHRHLRPVERMAHAEPLHLNLPAALAEMLGQQLLLGLHAGRSARTPPDRAELFQVFVRPGAAERNIL